MNIELMTNWIDKLLKFGYRRPGQIAGNNAENYIKNEFQKIGLKNVKQEKIPIKNWIESSWSLKVKSEANIFDTLPSHYIPYTAFTNSVITAPLIYAGEGKINQLKNLDFKGKIVVVEFSFPILDGSDLKKLALSVLDKNYRISEGPLHEATWIRPAWHVYHKAVKAGAVGFIGILTNQPGDLDSYYAPYGFKEGNAILKKPLPGFWVNRKVGKQLKKMAIEEQEAQIELKGSSEDSFTSNISGVIPGETDETIIIASHHDAPFGGATEDASGISVVLQIAKSLIDDNIKPKKTLLFLATGGHFYGSIGTRTFIKEHPEIIDRTLAEIHIEHIANEAVEKNGRIELTGFPEPAALFVSYNKKCVSIANKILKKNNLDPTFILPAEGPLGTFPPTDGGDFHLKGIPVFNYISNPVYLLVNYDKRENICFERLIPTAKAFKSLVLTLDQLSKEELLTKNYFFKKIIGKFAAWKSKRKLKRVYGPGVEI